MKTNMISNETLDRYFYLSMAILFALAAVIGFTPNSIEIIMGTKDNPPLYIHLHAATMSAWMFTLASQAYLISQNKVSLHRKLGKLSAYLAIAVLVLMIYIAWPFLIDPYRWPPATILQSKRILLFVGCVGLAVYLHNKQPEAHKRLMFMATFAVLDAAFFRMAVYLPRFGIEYNTTLGHIYQLILIVPLLSYDYLKFKRIHWVYIVTIPIIVLMELGMALARDIWPVIPR